MATVIKTEKTIDKGVRVLKSKDCPFFCVRNHDGKAIPCDLYSTRGARELCLKDEECQD